MANKDDKKDGKDQPEEVEYPEGQEYIRDIVKPYRDKIWQLNQQIDKLDQKQVQEPPKYTMTHNPPGYLRTRVPPSYNRDILVNQREDVHQQLDKRVGVEIKELESNEQLAVREAVRDDVDRNPFLGKSKEELEKFKGESKDLSVSQNFNMMLMKNFRKELQEKNISHSAETKEQPDQKAEQALSPSTRFNKTLAYTKALENKNDMTQKEITSPQKSQGKEER